MFSHEEAPDIISACMILRNFKLECLHAKVKNVYCILPSKILVERGINDIDYN